MCKLTLGQWRREIRARGQCERCPNTERLHAHHKDRDKANNTLANGECLCVWCHADEHDDPALIAYDNAARNHTTETRRKISEANRGKTLSPETRAALSKAKRGQPKSAAHKAAISAALKASAKRDLYNATRRRAVTAT